ncbi:MAG: (E)-4-hydroxy-3-methylbut-2-enyl-diphosphate synthase [Ignavibacteriota bacterium]|nr:(E)-4-hydroxy-3-methylbut-2-enyl-diphosphate synthase [Ignavibacteriota bacterium]
MILPKPVYQRFKTRVVNIGDLPLGGDNPIRLQSMTTTDSMDTIATVEQSIRIIEAGGEYVRITAPSIKEANNLLEIKNELRKRGYKAPLIADIHFTPNAAEIAARIVEKVRVNPGNYADKKKFETIEYTDNEYSGELERIRNKFIPLIKICKEYGTAMRIGTNHGSLSDRIMSRFGDTPEGMVESAMEFLRICEGENYYNIVLSMKSSNPQVMVQAYRMLVKQMMNESMNYPFHLGVTEAGDGEDGRIKSSLGIGTLLEEGLGDTVRVSLTEEPEYEIPVCKTLVERYSDFSKSLTDTFKFSETINPFAYSRRESSSMNNIGGKNVPVVVFDANDEIIKSHEALREVGYYYSESLDKWNIGDMAPDYIYLGSRNLGYSLPGTLKKIFDYAFLNTREDKSDSLPLLNTSEYLALDNLNFNKFLEINNLSDEILKKISSDKNLTLIINTKDSLSYRSIRDFAEKSISDKIDCPVIIKRNYDNLSEDKFMVYPATDVGGLLIDGFGDGIWLESNTVSKKVINSISFGILQASRTRISKTEYISCPSCGRTLFDLQETTAKVREKTSHLKGLKIAIMGCIVNGPGEMADADYGYVGSGVGKITLYKGKEVIRRSIDSETAVEELINLIKENNDWVNPE